MLYQSKLKYMNLIWFFIDWQKRIEIELHKQCNIEVLPVQVTHWEKKYISTKLASHNRTFYLKAVQHWHNSNTRWQSFTHFDQKFRTCSKVLAGVLWFRICLHSCPFLLFIYLFICFFYDISLPGGNYRGLRAILSLKCKKEPLKLAIDCNVKACSMLQI